MQVARASLKQFACGGLKLKKCFNLCFTNSIHHQVSYPPSTSKIPQQTPKQTLSLSLSHHPDPNNSQLEFPLHHSLHPSDHKPWDSSTITIEAGFATSHTALESSQMSSTAHHHRHQTGLLAATSRLRSCLTWFFFLLLLLYVLYSSKLILFPPSCPLPSNLQKSTLPLPLTNSSTNLSKEQEEEEETIFLPVKSRRYDTETKHIMFCIAASSALWDKRKEYLKLWWKPKETRGVVWLDKKVRTRRNEKLPEIRISESTAKFKYTNRQGDRSALRISRAVSETLRLGMKDVRWFVMGDDDTVFMVENLVRVLSKYDHNQLYYVGSSSESHIQNIFFSYAMAFGGGGFAISYPLAKELEKMQDRCIQRYPGLYGSDDRMQACMAELGVPLTKEPGFHQYDVYGNLLGLLGAHPITPMVSLHHLDVVDPIFPQMKQVQALRHLFESTKDDSASMMQQSICFDRSRQWSITVSWGYVVQIIRGVMSPRELEMPTRTFLNWYKRADFTAYSFNTRPVTRHPCQKPFLFYVKSSQYNQGRKQIIGVYARDRKDPHPYCRWQMDSPEKIDSIVVLKRPDTQRWNKAPRRDCCRVQQSSKSSQMYIWVGNCREGEVSEL